MTDLTYSPDVEIGPDGKLYWTRDIAKGETISIPMHMMDKAHPDQPNGEGRVKSL